MAARLGKALYWTATIITGLIAMWVTWSYVYDIGRGEPIIRVIALLFAGAIWLVGRACRYMLAER